MNLRVAHSANWKWKIEYCDFYEDEKQTRSLRKGKTMNRIQKSAATAFLLAGCSLFGACSDEELDKLDQNIEDLNDSLKDLNNEFDQAVADLDEAISEMDTSLSS
jgi:outer membrane murein-binding lipoprotein Lpp